VKGAREGEVCEATPDVTTEPINEELQAEECVHDQRFSPPSSPEQQDASSSVPWIAVEQFYDAVPFKSMMEVLMSSGNTDISAKAILQWYCETFWSLCCMAVAVAFWVSLVVIPLTCICSPAVEDTTSIAVECWEFILAFVLVVVSMIGVGFSSYMLSQGPAWLVLVMLAFVGEIQYLSLQAPGPSFLEFVYVVVLSPIRRNLGTLTS
jgi:hypothetical protein